MADATTCTSAECGGTLPWDSIAGPQRADYESDIAHDNARLCWEWCGKAQHGPCLSQSCPRRGVGMVKP
jgi:hypothetical protein